MTLSTSTVGRELVRLLEAHGVDVVFGIPGVHTAELYRGLARSSIRHVTPRSEQDAGFMADGYRHSSLFRVKPSKIKVVNSVTFDDIADLDLAYFANAQAMQHKDDVTPVEM